MPANARAPLQSGKSRSTSSSSNGLCDEERVRPCHGQQGRGAPPRCPAGHLRYQGGAFGAAEGRMGCGPGGAATRAVPASALPLAWWMASTASIETRGAGFVGLTPPGRAIAWGSSRGSDQSAARALPDALETARGSHVANAIGRGPMGSVDAGTAARRISCSSALPLARRRRARHAPARRLAGRWRLADCRHRLLRARPPPAAAALQPGRPRRSADPHLDCRRAAGTLLRGPLRRLPTAPARTPPLVPRCATASPR